MSINYKAFYGYGFEITDEQISALSPEKFDELMDSEYTQQMNGWGDSYHSFFGLNLISMDDGELHKIPTFIDDNELKNMLKEYLSIFGDEAFSEVTNKIDYYVGFAVT